MKKNMPEKIKALELRLEGKTFTEIGEELGRHSSTVSKWLKEEKLSNVLDQARDEAIEEAKGILIGSVVPAARTMEHLALFAKNELTRYRAALFILRSHGLQPPKVSIILEKKQITIFKKIIGEK